MKSMNDRKLPMSKGKADSSAFFPEESYHKKMARVGDINDKDYPDTEEQIHARQEGSVKKINSHKLKGMPRY